MNSIIIERFENLKNEIRFNYKRIDATEKAIALNGETPQLMERLYTIKGETSAMCDEYEFLKELIKRGGF